MKTKFFTLSLLAISLATVMAQEKGASKLMAPERPTSGLSEPPTFSSFDRPNSRSDGEMFGRGGMRFVEADVTAVLKIYQELSGRTVIRPGNLPGVKITLENQTPLNRREALQALDSALAANQITMILQGTKFVKAVPASQAPTETAPLVDLPSDQLPESSSYMMYYRKVKGQDAAELVPILLEFAKMPKSIIAIRSSGCLILRDYSANVRRMLQVLERLEKAPLSR